MHSPIVNSPPGDVWSRRHVTFDWNEWRPELAWMACYFSVAVWCSIGLVHAPVPRHDDERSGRD